jgi:microcystin-dependent protein
MDGYVGEVKVFAGNYAPDTWQLCQGQTLQIVTNQALYSLLGARYGGNGSTTFALPDCRGRVVIGTGQAASSHIYSLGDSGGNEQISLTVANMPAHSHVATVTIQGRSGAGNTRSPSGHILAAADDRDYSDQASDVTLGGASATLQSNGSGTQFSIIPPYIAMNWIICLTGQWPSQPG